MTEPRWRNARSNFCGGPGLLVGILLPMGIAACFNRSVKHTQAMTAELARQAWFVRVRTTEKPPILLDYAVGKSTVQEAIAAILYRPELDLGDEVTLTSQLTATEISSYRLKPNEVRTYGRRIYSAAAGRWVFEPARK